MTSTLNVNEKRTGLHVWLIIASLIGLYSSAKLTLEKISYWQQLAEGNTPVLGCDISPLIGCGTAVNSGPGTIFWDIPNPIIGIVAFSALGALAVLLMSGVKLPEWTWMGLQGGVFFGLGIVSYLQYQAIYNLGSLCPYCLVVWTIMIITFWLVTSRNLAVWAKTRVWSRVVHRYTPVWIVFHFALLFMLIWFQFGTRLFA